MFQRTLAQGRFTLALMTLFAAVAWLVLPPPFSWQLVGGLLASAVSLYLLAELNNAFVLLRINSRMISGTLALLLAPAVMLHELQAAHLILLCSVVAYFPLLAAYQRPRATTFVYLAFLVIGISSVPFPQLLHFLPICWISLFVLRAWSLKAWVASLLGILTPWCFLLTWAYCADQMPLFSERFTSLMRIDRPDFAAWSVLHFVVAGITLLHFLVGAIDFLLTKHLDKTRTRYHYYTALLHGAMAFAWLLLQPQYFPFIIPLCMTNAAMLSGHFAALSYGKIQNIIVCLFAVLTVAACVLAFLQV